MMNVRLSEGTGVQHVSRFLYALLLHSAGSNVHAIADGVVAYDPSINGWGNNNLGTVIRHRPGIEVS